MDLELVKAIELLRYYTEVIENNRDILESIIHDKCGSKPDISEVSFITVTELDIDGDDAISCDKMYAKFTLYYEGFTDDYDIEIEELLTKLGVNTVTKNTLITDELLQENWNLIDMFIRHSNHNITDVFHTYVMNKNSISVRCLQVEYQGFKMKKTHMFFEVSFEDIHLLIDNK